MISIDSARVIRRGKEMLDLYRCVFKEPIIDRVRLLNFSGFYTWAVITNKLKNFSEKLENDEDCIDFIRDIEIGMRIYYETDITPQFLEDTYDLLLCFPYTPWSMLGMLTRDYNQSQTYGSSTIEAVRNRWMEFDIHDETDSDSYTKAVVKIKLYYAETFKDYLKK
jgi:hypothetical protein